MDWLVAQQMTAVILLVIPGYTAFFLVPVFDIGFSDWLRFVLAFELALGLVASPGVFLIARRFMPETYRWLRGEKHTAAAAAAWECTLAGLPRMIVRILAWECLLAIGPVLYVSHSLSFDWYGYVLYYLVILALTGMVGVFGYLFAEQALRPVVREIAGHLPSGFESDAGVSFARKALILIPAINFFTALVVGALARNSIEPQLYMGSLLGLAVLVSATVSLVLTLMVRHSLLQRIGDLRAAMRRVDAGDFDARVVQLAGDELDDLGTTFNDMVEGLREREALRDDNAELNRSLQDSRARIVAAADQERRRLERDLHDGAQQHLVMIGLKLGLARRKLRSDPDAAEAMMEELTGSLSVALAELRDLAHGIYPALLEHEGLGAALKHASSRAAIPTSVVDDTVRRYPPDVEAAVYFCCLEALQNASKHAGASASAVVHLTDVDGVLCFEVADDGSGFSDHGGSTGTGLQNMHDRIGALGGTLRITSGADAGTTIAGSVPRWARPGGRHPPAAPQRTSPGRR